MQIVFIAVDQEGRDKILAAHPLVKLMKEMSSQTTPKTSFRSNGADHTDYKTIVRVYDSSATRADIIEVQRSSLGANPSNGQMNGSDNLYDAGHVSSMHPHAVSNGLQTTDIPIYATVQPRKNAKLTNGNVLKYPMNGLLISDAESDSSTHKNSVNSFESFQTKAMKAIKALDEVVANEPSDMDSSSILNMHGTSISSDPPMRNYSPSSPIQMAPPVPPAPPPPGK